MHAARATPWLFCLALVWAVALSGCARGPAPFLTLGLTSVTSTRTTLDASAASERRVVTVWLALSVRSGTARPSAQTEGTPLDATDAIHASDLMAADQDCAAATLCAWERAQNERALMALDPTQLDPTPEQDP